MQHGFTFIELFAGIGGFRLALEQLGGHCVYVSEIDKYACQTYSANFESVVPSDITKTDVKDVPYADMIVGGFPCQPFSNAGNRRGIEDARGTLFFDVARIIEAKRPKTFILENVPGLKTIDKGRHYSRFG